MAKSERGRFLAIFLVLLISVSVLVWVLQRRRNSVPPATAANRPEQPVNSPSPTVQSQPSPLAPSSPETPQEYASPTTAPTAVQPPPPSADEGQSPSPQVIDPGYVGKLNLIIPVSGVKASQLLDTFADARSEGRVHDAIDIPAPQGTPVLAAADGEIIKLFQSERGGTTIYQLSTDKKIVYYYAHLQGYVDGLAAGKLVHQAEVIGYVGDTGNAGAGNYHLHFSIAIVSDPRRYWEGTNINPYPLLHK
jgi:murein DD-endopeptidase MepM/ murein hydrolase activator NlpD